MHALATPEISVELDVEALYRSHAGAVLARCRRMLRNDADAEEACQEVFLRAHRFRHSFRGDANPTTWLYQLTTNTCLSRIRTRGRRPEDLVDPLDSALLAHVPSADVGHEIEQRDLIRDVVARLDPELRDCVVRTLVEGMTLAEVAAATGLRVSVVRKRLERFRRDLRGDRGLADAIAA